VEIVNTTTDPASQSSASLIRFTIKAVFQRPGEAAPVAPATKTGG